MFSRLVVVSFLMVGCGPSTGASGPKRASDMSASSGDGGTQMMMSCANGQPTTLAGTVFAPDGKLPLYDAIVYVPGAIPDPLPKGVTCDRCNGHVSGAPIVQTLSKPDGSFTLVGAPSGSAVPLVIQLGKWRRQITLDVPACAITNLTADQTRLPRNKSEGELPQLAIATGNSDPFECLFLKIGIDPAEITDASHDGRIHLYTATNGPGTNLATPAPTADTLFANAASLARYDVVILPCEGSAFIKDTTQRALLAAYLSMGGRLFATHFSYSWLAYTSSPFNKVGSWDLDQTPYPTGPYDGTLDVGFPKGVAFAQWLAAVAPGISGAFPIVDPRNDLDAVDPTYAQRWVYHAGDDKTLHVTFNTPLDAPPDDMGQPAVCGRVVYSDFHVSANEANYALPFPSACISGPLTTQEKALVFMLFDLSSCVVGDTIPPII